MSRTSATAKPSARASSTPAFDKGAKSARIERRVLYVAACLALLFSTYILRSALVAREEPDLFAAAEPLPAAAERVPGTLYRVEGPLTGHLLTPPEFPMVQDAIQVRAVKELRESTASTSWKAKTSGDGKMKSFMANELKIGGAPFILGGGTRLVADVSEAYIAQGELMRVQVRWIPAAGKTFVAYGIWNGTALGDSTSATGVLAEATQVDAALAAVSQLADRRVRVDFAVALVLLVLAVGTAYSAHRGARSSNAQRRKVTLRSNSAPI